MSYIDVVSFLPGNTEVNSSRYLKRARTQTNDAVTRVDFVRDESKVKSFQKKTT